MEEIRKLPKKEFPEGLIEIPQPPKELYIQGNLPSKEDGVLLAVVGSRRFTTYGRDVCEKIFSGLRNYPIVIVSGLAIGIDTLAHQNALKNGLKTIAMPGSGIDRKVLHPSSNRRLADEIIKSGGCLLSEYEPKLPAGAWTFPRRNRLMAGLSKAVLIIEAGERSGTLITARLATEYNRDVLAIPGSIFSSNSSGTNSLIRQGATPINSSENLLEALGFPSTSFETNLNELENCSLDEKRILEILDDPMPKDELVRILEIPINEINSILSIMEIKGFIREDVGKLHRII